jgi:hypothetical protein
LISLAIHGLVSKISIASATKQAGTLSCYLAPSQWPDRGHMYIPQHFEISDADAIAEFIEKYLSWLISIHET